MDEKIQAALSAFNMTAAEFNRQDTTTADLRQVERELADSKIGIEFWDMEDDLVSKRVAEDDMPKGVPAGFEQYYEACQLGFAKFNDRWQLAVRYGIQWYDFDEIGAFTDSGYLETSTQPLAQATRTIRVKAVASLPQFLKAFDNHLKKYSKDIRNNDLK